MKVSEEKCFLILEKYHLLTWYPKKRALPNWVPMALLVVTKLNPTYVRFGLGDLNLV